MSKWIQNKKNEEHQSRLDDDSSPNCCWDEFIIELFSWVGSKVSIADDELEPGTIVYGKSTLFAVLPPVSMINCD